MRSLLKNIFQKLFNILVIFICFNFCLYGQNHNKENTIEDHSANVIYPMDTVVGGDGKTYLDYIEVDEKHAEKFGKLLVQDQKGRLKPINTFSSELLRKVYGTDEYYNLSSNQVLLSSSSNPMLWSFFPIIKVKNHELKNILDKNVKGNHFSYAHFFDQNGGYILSTYHELALQKKPASRTKFDNAVINTTEKFQVYAMMLTTDYLNIFPVPNDKNNKWVNVKETYNYDSMIINSDSDSVVIGEIMFFYLQDIMYNNLSSANEMLSVIEKYQKKAGQEIYLSDFKIKSELFYNNLDVFKRLSKTYVLVGLLYLIFAFVFLFKNKKIIKHIIKVFFCFSFILFICHLFGLILRWYISGHAPWSDAYESMIWISCISVLAGLIFAKKSHFAFAAGLINASILLNVAHLNWVDPEITNLVPVLKSYWLMIHVSVITSSYGFLALGALLGFINLISLILNIPRKNILKLTYINESALTIGIILLTIGTFLGGVWANESWGRYWGWDPKETWALISILVYAFVLHTRFIPKLNNVVVFNILSLLGYYSIIMTYFGVNHLLAGLHSYAKGDPVPIPNGFKYSVIIIIILGVLSYIRYKKSKLHEIS